MCCFCSGNSITSLSLVPVEAFSLRGLLPLLVGLASHCKCAGLNGDYQNQDAGLNGDYQNHLAAMVFPGEDSTALYRQVDQLKLLLMDSSAGRALLPRPGLWRVMLCVSG